MSDSTRGEEDGDARLKALSKFAEDFVELFENSDMRPEDECHDLYNQANYALNCGPDPVAREAKKIMDEQAAKIIHQFYGAKPADVEMRAYGCAGMPPGVFVPLPDLPPTESIQRDALDALHGMLTNKSANIEGHFYAVRDREGLGWEGPDMVAWGAAIEKAKDVLRRAGRMI